MAEKKKQQQQQQTNKQTLKQAKMSKSLLKCQILHAQKLTFLQYFRETFKYPSSNLFDTVCIM